MMPGTTRAVRHDGALLNLPHRRHWRFSPNIRTERSDYSMFVIHDRSVAPQPLSESQQPSTAEPSGERQQQFYSADATDKNRKTLYFAN